MKSNFILKSIGLILVCVSCGSLRKQVGLCNSLNEVQIDKTEMSKVFKLLGKNDDAVRVYADGRSSGHSSSWEIYKKLGLVFESTSYTPERQDGYKNGIVRRLEIFDTTNLYVNGSKQQETYNEQDYSSISLLSLKTFFGKAEIFKRDTLEYCIYNKRQMTFVFNIQNKRFLRLYITKSLTN